MLPAAASLKAQGANNGATTSFLISTPESGVDSMAITYALLDPIMTITRPFVAFATATAAGITENLFDKRANAAEPTRIDLSCPIDGCCDGIDCSPQAHRDHHSLAGKVGSGIRYAFKEVWSDIALWFFIGLLLAGMITTLVPPEIFTAHLGGGISSMFIMLTVGIPLYICATASTPIAASLIMSGVSPGAALVFLITGPATNVTSLTVLLKVLGKRGTVIYLFSIAAAAVVFGMALDGVYGLLDISARATAGHASEVIPDWVKLGGAMALLILSIAPLLRAVRSRFPKTRPADMAGLGGGPTECKLPMAIETTGDCGCSGAT